jgi:hypothetical protein
VRRNRLWFECAVPILQQVWETIENERRTGYEHRAPAKRKSASIEAPATEAGLDSVLKIVKLDTALITENHETTATNMASLMSLYTNNKNNIQKKYSSGASAGGMAAKRPSDVLINCFKIDELEIDESKVE